MIASRMASLRTDSRVPGAGPHPGERSQTGTEDQLRRTRLLFRLRGHQGPQAVTSSISWARKADDPPSRATDQRPCTIRVAARTVARTPDSDGNPRRRSRPDSGSGSCGSCCGIAPRGKPITTTRAGFCSEFDLPTHDGSPTVTVRHCSGNPRWDQPTAARAQGHRVQTPPTQA
jgi:hypothetical protein